MENQIAIIGNGATKEAIETVIAEKGIDNVIVIDGSIPVPIKVQPELLIPELRYGEYKDGRMLRRERRKRERKNKTTI